MFGALDESFVPAMGVGGGSIIAVALQSDGKVLVGGVFTFPGNRIARLHADGSLDGTFQTGTGFNGEVDRITVQMDGKILVGGGFTSYSGVSCGHIARLNVDGSLDTSFNTGIGFTGYNAPRIESIVVQPNGKILAGGSFDAFNGINRYGIVRLANDGSLDPSFAIEFGLFPVVNSFALRPDGKLVVGGNGNVVRRLNTDGTNDLGFTAAFFGGGLYSVALQPDGKILVGGNFGSPNGYDRNFTRLNEEGTLDLLFDTGVGFDRWVKPILVQPDGNLIVGGSFRSIAGWGRNHMARLGANGSLDQNFLPNGTGANDEVSVMVLRPDGRMVVGGSFTAYNGVGSNYLIQLDGEGNVDPTFNIGTGFDQPFITGIADLVLQADGKLVAAGTFQYFNGSVRHGILRLNVDGSLDATFTIGAGFDQYVSSIALQSDGKILVGGGFTSFNGTARSRIARLNPNGTLDASFGPGTGFDEWVGSIAVQPDGRMHRGWLIHLVQRSCRAAILRLNSNATLDTSLRPRIRVQ
ncbi:MAG: delta-60 repeat domain-containing protein [Flavobacteriales bacterium]|nr:delta-60 repeat domain-containing protein [Flavobacteriales bacterium]